MNLMKKTKADLCRMIELKDEELQTRDKRIKDLYEELDALDDIRQLHTTKADLDEQQRWIDCERNGIERERLANQLEAEKRITEVLMKALLGQSDVDGVQP